MGKTSSVSIALSGLRLDKVPHYLDKVRLDPIRVEFFWVRLRDFLLAEDGSVGCVQDWGPYIDEKMIHFGRHPPYSC